MDNDKFDKKFDEINLMLNVVERIGGMLTITELSSDNKMLINSVLTKALNNLVNGMEE